jgi:thioredoxin reductase
MGYDAIVIGGSFAGLSAAMQLARARRNVLIMDTGQPRNRFSSESHGFFAQDGVAPLALIAAGREKVVHYPNVRFVQEEAKHAERDAGGAFTVEARSGERFQASKLLIASGVVDELPAIPGMKECWGESVLLCPYCHGYEFGGMKLGVLYVGPLSAHQASLIMDWGKVTLFTQGAALDAEALAMLAARDVQIEPSQIVELVRETGRLSGVRVADGRVVPVVALFLGTRVRMASPIAERLGCAFDEGPFGPFIRTDEFKLTTVPGVYAAGDVARAMPNATFASYDGVTAGTAMHRAMVFGDAPHPPAGPRPKPG